MFRIRAEATSLTLQRYAFHKALSCQDLWLLNSRLLIAQVQSLLDVTPSVAL
jgi:hypothetical protein